MLASAHEGRLDEKPYARRWSVYAQQAASFVAQAKLRGRSRKQLLELADEVWPEAGGGKTATRILDKLLEDERLIVTRGRVTLGEEWSDLLGKGGGNFHNNLDTEGTGTPVVDASTGEVIARVQNMSVNGNTMALGGQRWDVVSESGEILLKPAQGRKETETFRYAARAAPTGYNFARHVLIGMGFQKSDAPLIEDENGIIWLHCGGTAYECVLLSLFPELSKHGSMKGLAVRGMPDIDRLETLRNAPDQIRDKVSVLTDNIAFVMAPGPYQRMLPEDVQREVVLALFDVDGFIEWLCSRRILTPSAGDKAMLPWNR
jgi:hypothetical protein